MLFQFLKYLQPTHYFTLPRYDGKFIFPEIESIDEDILVQLETDMDYKSDLAKNYDICWQAINKGYIGEARTLVNIEPIPLIDDYRFIRKYFSGVWVFYVLLIRLLSLKNPINEIRAWFNTRSVKRSNHFGNSIQYRGWDNFESKLIQSNPKVGIIIPTLNRYDYLKDVLKDLENQDYKNFEVIVVDQSTPFNVSFYEAFDLSIDVIYQEEKALWLARNSAIKKFNGDYLLFFDDDSRVNSNWVSNHLKCLDFFNADVSSGVSISKVGAKVPAHYSYFKISDQLDTGNVMIRKSVFKKIGLYDRQFEKQRMGDGEFGMRVYLNNILNVSNPYTKRLHLKVDKGGLREMGSWDAFRTKTLFDPRPIPSVLYFYRRYFGVKLSRYALMHSVPLSIMPYQFKKNKRMLILGVFVSFILLPVITYQVMKSWHLATKKLKQGPLIETLK